MRDVVFDNRFIVRGERDDMLLLIQTDRIFSVVNWVESTVRIIIRE